MKVIIYHRVLSKYRYDLYNDLCFQFTQLKVVASKGEKIGAQRSIAPPNNTGNLIVDIVKCISFKFQGDKRHTYIPIYPFAYFKMIGYDVVVLEGTTNIFNNMFLIPIAKILGKKIVWWDSGCSEPVRSRSRKVKDFILQFLVKSTDVQMAYSSQAKEYLTKHMGSKNCVVNVNTVNTDYFKNKYGYYAGKIESKVTASKECIQLLYVGAIEERKKLFEFIKLIHENKLNTKFTIIGNGSYRNELREKCEESAYTFVKILDPIYEFEQLEEYYMRAHFFLLTGEGGLGIIQAMHFGVPVITVPADGTELDYILNKSDGYLVANQDEAIQCIKVFNGKNEEEQIELFQNVLNKAQTITSNNWVKTFKIICDEASSENSSSK